MKIFKIGIGIALTMFIASCETQEGNEGGGYQAIEPESSVQMPAPAPTGNAYYQTINAIGNSMADMAYDVSALAVNAGDSVVLTLINQGSDPAMQHNVVIVQNKDIDMVKNRGDVQGKAGVIAASALIGPGEKTTFRFIAPMAGEYIFLCTFPGHYPKMQGRFLVK